MKPDAMPPAGADGWLAEVARTLRGADLADLTSATRDGIEIQPLYTDGPARPEAARAAVALERIENGWDVRTRHILVTGAAGRGGGSDAGSGAGDGNDMGPGAGGVGLVGPGAGGGSVGGLNALQRRIDDDLAGGATSVELETDAGVIVDDLSRVLAGVDLSKTPLALAPHASLDTAEALGGLASRLGYGPAAGSSLGLDPLGEWARSGQFTEAAPAAERVTSILGGSRSGGDRPVPAAESGLDGTSAVSGPAPRLGPGAMAFTVDAVRYAEAGATEAQTLGWATATGVAYLRALVKAGLSVDAAAGLIGFRLAATADQFVTIASLRAARVMWSRVVTASGGSEGATRQFQHSVTASHVYSRRDPWVNLLRGASAALAAGVGGADAVTVLPFDHASGLVDDDGALGRRLARNTQLLLLEESHLARAADPAGGSFYAEALTEQLASAGWRVLQDVEASGGIEAAIDKGAIAAAIDESWQSRLGALRTRSDPLTGVSEFPLLDESVPSSLADSHDAGDGAGLPVRRLSEPFEDLRDAADHHRAATGERPAVWVAALGPASAHSARTAWVQNLLAAGGIEARSGPGVDSPIAAAADFAASGLTAGVITGTDDMYRLRAAATAAALAEAGAALVALACDAGTLAGQREMLTAAGVSDFWEEGIDVVAALERLHGVLGLT